MGTLRIILAISVVIAHSSKIFGFEIVGGQIAVQAFYIISGFYMTLILNEKYIGKNDSYKLFITNRLLRLYPIYWTVLLLTILASVGINLVTTVNYMGKIQPYINHFQSLNMGSLLFLVLTNIIIFFQDFVMFLGIDKTTGGLFFTSNFQQTHPQLWTFLLVPQAWSIGIEISFYLIAPFIVRKKLSFIYGLLLLSTLLRILLFTNGLDHDPWTYRFFPTELLFFLLGTLAYHTYKKIDLLNLKKPFLMSIYVFILLFTLSYSWIPITNKMYIYFTSFFLSLPFVFILTKRWKRDRYIGELSYPIYISHLLVLMIVRYMKIPETIETGLVATVVSLFFSVLLNELIAKKIELFRQKRLKTSTSNELVV